VLLLTASTTDEGTNRLKPPLMRKLVMIDTEVPPALLPLPDVRSLTPLPLSRRHGVIM